MYLHISKHRETIDVLRFLRRALRYYESNLVLVTDGGPWYQWPTRRLGLKHIVMSGRERNHIKRWFETFKDRLHAFDCCFPTPAIEDDSKLCRGFLFLVRQMQATHVARLATDRRRRRFRNVDGVLNNSTVGNRKIQILFRYTD